MKPGNILTLLALTLLIAACGGGGGGGSSPAPVTPAPPPAPEPTSIDYSFSGAAIKGAISGATVSIVDANGNSVDSTTVTESNGTYQISFNVSDELQLPLLISIDATNATAVCDLEPVCNIGNDANGNPVSVAFGETYSLPDGFMLRAAIESLDDAGDGTNLGTAYVSPMSEFVVAAALAMGNGTQLTTNNLAVANERVASILRDVYPQLDIPAGLQVATFPLIDITDAENADFTNTSDLSLVISSLSAALLSFVDPDNTERQNIALVLAEFSDAIASNAGNTGPLLSSLARARLSEAAIDSLSKTVGELQSLQDQGKITLPDSTQVSDLNNLVNTAQAALPEVANIWSNLTAEESVTLSISAALGSADLVYLPDTGEAEVNLETMNMVATKAYLQMGFAGESGDVLVELEQDAGNVNRWQFPANTILEPDTITAISNGQAYFNVTSAAYPSGELRGQVLPTGFSAYIVTPSGTQQAPLPVSTSHFAKAAITLNETNNLAQVHITTTTPTTVSAQIHQATAGTNGPIVVFTEPDSLNGNHWFSSDVEFTSGLISALNTGNLYFNIQTSAFPSGELRGQVLPSNYNLRISALSPGQVVSDETVTSSATGMSAITTNLTTNRLTAHVNLYQLDNPMTVQISHGLPGENGDPLFNLEADSQFDFIPPTTGVSHWFLENQALTATELATYLDGGFYIQATSAANPDGELRGQLSTGLTDSDGDGVEDAMDAFPQDPSETQDSDGDGVGDNSDAFPADATESNDADGDGVGDNADAFPDNPAETTDSDGDGTGDNTDECPNDPSGTVDTDDDGVCDTDDLPDDQDSDNDGVPDASDAFPNDPAETTDTDGDGVGDNSDAFPTNPAESIDSDGDGVGNNSDAFPNDASETLDSDGDGVGDNADAFPFDASETVDVDGDGIGDNADSCIVTVDPDDPDADDDGVVKDCEDAASFGAIQEIFDEQCVSCHGTDGGLTLTEGQSYNELVNVPSVDIPSLDRVEPGDSDMSYLVWKIEGRSGIVGTQQPPGGALPASDINAIKSWIDAGADP